jgi:hypothetical protein
MPMPPPKPTTEGPRDRHVHHEIDQVVRALRSEGPQDSESLARLVGAPYWDDGRFEKAVMFAVNDGLAVQMNDGRYGLT